MINDLSQRELTFVFYKPHANVWFRNTVKNIRANYFLPSKYASFFDYALNSENKIYFATALYYGGGVKGFLRSISDAIELIAWCILNKINLRKVGFIFTKNALAKKDIFFAMHYGNFTGELTQDAIHGTGMARYLADVSIYKIVHMTHYAYNPSIGNKNLKILSPNLLVAENNLERNSVFFKKYFEEFSGKFNTLSYTPAPRFVSRTPFADRINKLVATGSITFKMTDKEFLDHFGGNELQPLRRQLYEQASQYVTTMNSLIVDINDLRVVRPSRPKDTLQKRLVRRLKRSLKRNRPEDTLQDYYRKNIVDTYNEHRMFVVPEEVCDLPAIAFVEGMACGCAYFGLDSPMYRELGLVPGVHYVGYDGSIPDLMAKVRYYQKHTTELNDIANNGCEFVEKNLSPDAVYGAFFKQLKSIGHGGIALGAHG
jgi:hypothetical protein